MANLTSVAEWAKSLGISRQQGYAAVKRCGIAVTDGKLDAEYASILYYRHTQPRANGKRTAVHHAEPPMHFSAPDDVTGAVPGYDTSRAKREAAEASIAAMKEAEMQGDLIRIDSVKTALSVAFSTAREALLQIPSRLAPLIAAETDPSAVQNMLHAEIHQALQNLSGASERLGQPESELE